MTGTRCQSPTISATCSAVHLLLAVPSSKTPSPAVSVRGKLSAMETIKRQVGELQANERSAAELLLGHRLRGNEQLILQILELDLAAPPTNDSRPAQTLEDWCNVYKGVPDIRMSGWE